MGRNIARVKGIGYILWHGKHMVVHVLLGIAWVWMLTGLWDEFQFRWITLAAFGSLVPDIDHFLYFFTYGRKDPYTRTVVTYFKDHKWRVLTTFLERGHKHNTHLTFHNIYTIAVCSGVVWIASFLDWRAGAVFFGAVVSHFCFDIAEDMLLLGRMNPNWMRWGRGRPFISSQNYD